MKGHRNWGPWVYVAEYEALWIYPYEAAPDEPYEVALNRCRTEEEIQDWLRHLGQKTWGTPSVLSYLTQALNDLVRGN